MTSFRNSGITPKRIEAGARSQSSSCLDLTSCWTGHTCSKLVVAILGASASGKTTLRRRLTNSDRGAQIHRADHNCWFSQRLTCCGRTLRKRDLQKHLTLSGEHHWERGGVDVTRVCWTTFQNGTAVCGSPGSGADANPNLDAINFALDRALDSQDVVIFDGVMASRKLVNHLSRHANVDGVLWVMLNVSRETNIARLTKRRFENGGLPPTEATIRRVLNYGLQAKSVWTYARQICSSSGTRFVEIPEYCSPDQSHQLALDELASLVAQLADKKGLVMRIEDGSHYLEDRLWKQS